MTISNVPRRTNQPLLPSFQFLKKYIKWMQEGKDFDLDAKFIGGRWSTKTSSVEKFLIKALMCPNQSVDIEAARYQKNKIDDIHNSLYYQAKRMFKLNYLKFSKHCIIYKDNKLHSYGYKTQDPNIEIALGQHQADCKYKVLFFDEMRDWDSQEDYILVRQAKRNYQNLIVFECSNPWLLEMWWVKDCWNSYQPDILKLKENGYDIWIEEKEINGKMSVKIIMWSNCKVSWDFLPQALKNEYDRAKMIGGETEKVVCYGLPGLEKGSFFANVIKYINKTVALPYECSYFVAALDYGIVKDAMVVMIGALSDEGRKLNILENSYYHSNYNNPHFKDTKQQAKDIINYFVEMANKYPRMKQGIVCYVDDNSRAFIAELNALAYSSFLTQNWLSFRIVQKQQVLTGLYDLLFMFSKSLVNIHSSNKQLFNELSLCKVETTAAGTEKASDANNHCLDCLRYIVIILRGKKLLNYYENNTKLF